jgi:hypothetical protein
MTPQMRSIPMSYKRTITGKDKITGKLGQAMETFRSWHQADFPSGTLPKPLSFESYLSAMTLILTEAYQDVLKASRYEIDQEALKEISVLKTIYDRACHEEPDSYIRLSRYKLLDYIVEHSSTFAWLAERARQAIIDNKEELFL